MARNLERFRNAIKESVDVSDLGDGKIDSQVLEKQEDPSEIVYIDFANLVHNPRNTKGIDMSVDDLLATIPVVGLINPLLVRKDPIRPGKYLIMSGERRKRAFEKLFHDTNDRKYRSLPCVITDIESVNLPLSDDLKEDLIISTPNSNVRSYTFMQKAEMIENFERIYEALKAVDHDLSIYKDRRHYVSIMMHENETEVFRIKKIKNGLSEALKDMFDRELIGKMVALEISGLDVNQQSQLLKTFQEEQINTSTLTSNDIKRFVNTGSLKREELQVTRVIKPQTTGSNISRVEEVKVESFSIDVDKMKKVVISLAFAQQFCETHNNFTVGNMIKINKAILKIENELDKIYKTKGFEEFSQDEVVKNEK